MKTKPITLTAFQNRCEEWLPRATVTALKEDVKNFHQMGCRAEALHAYAIRNMGALSLLAATRNLERLRNGYEAGSDLDLSWALAESYIHHAEQNLEQLVEDASR